MKKIHKNISSLKRGRDVLEEQSESKSALSLDQKEAQQTFVAIHASLLENFGQQGGRATHNLECCKNLDNAKDVLIGWLVEFWDDHMASLTDGVDSLEEKIEVIQGVEWDDFEKGLEHDGNETWEMEPTTWEILAFDVLSGESQSVDWDPMPA